MHPERNNIEFPDPTTTLIIDPYGEEYIFAKNVVAGDVLSLAYDFDSDRGEYGPITIAGNFHGLARQNSLNFLKRLATQKRISAQEPQESVFVCAHPQIVVRGYVRNLKTDVKTTVPMFFNYGFDFVPSAFDRQPEPIEPLDMVMAVEGKEWVLMDVPGGITTLRDFAYKYYGRSRQDSEKILKLISLNGLGPSDALPAQLKVPLR